MINDHDQFLQEPQGRQSTRIGILMSSFNSILHNDQKQLLLEPRGTDFADKSQRIRGTTQRVRACNFLTFFLLYNLLL